MRKKGRDQLSINNAPLIVGLSSRVPGARTNKEMWNVLAAGRCTVTGVDERLFWVDQYTDPRQTRQGKAYSRSAGQLSNLYHFDAGFFGITPREAAQMDPQQRLMLQSVWEAVEDAGLNITDLAGDRTGVFVGSSIVENIYLAEPDPSRFGSSFSLGNTLCIIANRVSSVFDFRGPSIVMDAACASSLYAFHLATEALRRGEIDTAVVGGVHVVRSPGGHIGFSQARMISPSGLCRAFDAGADGYVRSEASIALILQRQEVAERMGARLRAKVLSTGVNSDGKTSQLTVPSFQQQSLLMDKVLSDSTIDPDDFSFFEAHGTGTQVGDPVEARSIGTALAMLRRDPLLIGSSKTNFGHAEPAAGLVAVSKTLLAFEHRALPASLHFRSPNPNVDFEGLNLKVNTRLTPLSETQPILAGVNSFGFGGVNVSVILQSLGSDADHSIVAAPAQPISVDTVKRRWLLISAATTTSLRSLAASWSGLLDSLAPTDWQDFSAAAGTRVALRERLAIPLDESAPSALASFAQGTTPAALVSGQVRLPRAQTVFGFPGNGTQVVGMGRAEYSGSALFRRHFDHVAAAFAEAAEIDLVACLNDEHLEEKLSSPIISQPLLFAFQTAYARSLQDSGIRADAVIGHSVGEIAALHVAGCFDLATAVHIIVSRSHAFEALRGKGSMAVVAATVADVERAISSISEPALVVAAVNSPRNVTVSGPTNALARLRQISIDGKRLAVVPLRVEVPYHSPFVEILRDRFMADLAGLSFNAPHIPVASSVLGRVLEDGECNSLYLWRNARDRVRFSEALTSLADVRPVNLVEISPVASFMGNVRDLVRQEGCAIEHILPCGYKDEDFGTVAVRGWTLGLRVKAQEIAGEPSGAAHFLPAYPWEEKEYFNSLSDDGLDLWGEKSKRLLAGMRADRASTTWVRDITPTMPQWISDHKVGEETVVPATALVEIALGAGAELWPDTILELRDFDIVAPVSVAGEGIRLRTNVDEVSGALTISQRPRLTNGEWALVARGALRKETASPRPKYFRRPKMVSIDATNLYDFLACQGLPYGKSFQRLQGLRPIGRRSVWMSISDPDATSPFLLDPMSFDAALHGLAHLIRDEMDPDLKRILDDPEIARALVPCRIDALRLWHSGAKINAAYLHVTRIRHHSLKIDLSLMDAGGLIIADVAGLEFTLIDTSSGRSIARSRARRRRVKLRLKDKPVVLPKSWPSKLVSQLGFQDAGYEKNTELQGSGVLVEAISEFRQALYSKASDVSAALERVLRLAPNLSSDLRVLMLLARGQDARAVAMYSHAHRQIWRAAEALVESLAKGWKSDQRLNLLISGVPDHAVLQRLFAIPYIDRIALTLPSDGTGSLLRALLPTNLRPLIVSKPTEGWADIVLNTDIDLASTNTLAPGGLALRLEIPELLPSDGALIGDAVWHRNVDGLHLRLSCMRKSMSSTEIAEEDKETVFAPTPVIKPDHSLPTAGDALEALLTEVDTTHRLLIYNAIPEMDLPEFLAEILGHLRKHAATSRAPLVLVCFASASDFQFETIAEALASMVRSMVNEVLGISCGALVVDSYTVLQGTCWAELINLALEQNLVVISSEGAQTSVFTPAALRTSMGPTVRLAQEVPGRLERLRWESQKLRPLGVRQIDISVSATGLNFRDVMAARGLLPEWALDLGAKTAGFGMEVSGLVRRVGGKVSGFAPGDRVVALGVSAFSSHLIVEQEAATQIPEAIDTITAAGVPVAFLTAWYALVDVARIKAGDSVLIHGAAGGVGLAAIQIAKMYGARILVTAGTPEKRSIALSYGAELAFNSRDLRFAEGIRRATGGMGVSIVLNSLAGEAMQRSVECLAPFGTFIELGKRDFLEGNRLNLQPFLRNLSYHSVDLDQIVSCSPETVNRAMCEIMKALGNGQLRPLPLTVFEATDTTEAFRHMLSSRHVGKIVVTPPKRERRQRRHAVHSDWVILGGNGGLGLALGQMLLSEGAKHVHLLSRSGEIALDNLKAGSWVLDDGRVTLHEIDAADRDQLSRFFDRLEAEGRSIGGIIHSAMVLRDRMLSEIDTFEAAQVLRAKLGVAIALDAVLRTRATQPEHVIFFSSIASQLGNIGQSAYSAANAAVEAIAVRRRRDGLPGVAVGWGPIGDAGYLSHSAAIKAQLSRLNGVQFLSIREVLGEVQKIIRTKHYIDYCYAAINWDELARHLPALTHPAYKALVSESATLKPNNGKLIERLRKQSWGDAIRIVRQEVRDMLGDIIRIPSELFDMDKPLNLHGIDSLMAMEMRLAVEERFDGSQLPASAISHDITGSKLAVIMLGQIRNESHSELP